MHKPHTTLPLLLCSSLILACGDPGNDDGGPHTTTTGTATGTGDGDPATDEGTDEGTEEGTEEGGEEPPSELEQICEEHNFEGCYYVSNTGNYPPGSEDHQLLIDEVSSQVFLPGEIILFARGDVWRQTGAGALITVPASGDEQEPLYFGAYGTGERPTFLGSIAASGWSEVGDDRWQAATDIPLDPAAIDAGAELFFELDDGDARFGHHEDGLDGLDRDGDWTWSAGKVTVYATQDPGSVYASVEAPQARRLIALDDQEHLSFDSLRLRYVVNAGFYDNYGNAAGLVGLHLNHVEIGYIGVKNSSSAYGLSLERSGVHIEHSRIHDCGRRGVSLVLYSTPASAIRDVLIEHNHFHGGYHTTGVDVQSNTASSGSHVIENLVIRANLFAGDPDYDIQGEDGHASNHIFMNQDEGAILREVYIYANVFSYAQGSAIKTSGGEDIYIHHNTFYGFNPSYDNYQAQIFGGSRSRNTVIANNVFFNDAADNRYACVEFGVGQEAEYTIDHNLYYASSYDHARLLWVDGGTSYFFDDDWDSYTGATGFDLASPTPADPGFGGAPEDLRPGDGSPAIGAGVPVEWISADFHGDPLGDPPDLGAIQHAP